MEPGMQSSDKALDPDGQIQLPLELKAPNGDTVLMRLNPETDPDGLISRLDMEKIPSSDGLSRALGSVPQIASAIALSQSFRIVMPAGVIGNLVTLVKDPAMSGLATTSIVGGGGRIIGTAGLASMGAFIAPVVVWTILAFLTGQFFLTQIQRNTRAIFEELRNILYFLVAKEESDLGAKIEFLHYVSTNFNALNRNSEMRVSTLTNLQKINIESLAALKLWTYNIERELEDISIAVDLVRQNKDRKNNIGKVVNLVGETRQHINRALASWQCYSLGSTLEIQLGSIFDPSLLDYTKKSLAQQATGFKSALVKAENIWNDCRNISHFSESPQFKAGQIHEFSRDLTEFTERIDSSIDSSEKYISGIETLETKGINLLYYNNSFYRPSQKFLSSND
ncbi:MAG: hypothetical protein WBB82_10825 [Limnothrix sp.]